MQGIVHITPAIWLRNGERSPVCLGDADDLADWLGRTCALLMRTSAVGNGQILELEEVLARVEAVIDAGDPYLPAELRRDIVATVARLNRVTTAVPDDDGSALVSSSPPATGRTDATRQHGRPQLRLHGVTAAGRRGS
ncbi:hypothetical protein QFZ27_000107 [Inquilinus ginsengisoli]|jgi:hypothetical protein|uniref:hypothetical protein n=1 Tax=Inquilinus ginsengisoli TaxID=363840 RepID=UPI003D26264E